MALSARTIVDRAKEQMGDLLEERKGGFNPKRYKKYKNRPVQFIKEVLGADKIWDKQIEIAESVRDNRWTHVRSANGIGKDFIAAQLALHWVYAGGGYVLFSGQTLRQVKEVCMGETRRAFMRADGLPGQLFEQQLRIRDADQNVGILALTSSDVSRLSGFHAPKVLVILTEAQGIEPFAYEAFRACAVGDDDRFLIVGNPLEPSGEFYKLAHSETVNAIRISAWDHPNVQQGKIVIPGAITQTFVDEAKRDYGEGSAYYTARVEGEFPDSSDNLLCQRSWIDEAIARFERGDLNNSNDEAIIAIDPARFGPDHTCMCLRYGDVIRQLVTWSKLSTMETVGRIRKELVDRNLGHVDPRIYGPGLGSESVPIIVDEVGLGSGVLDRLKEEGYDALGHNGSTQASDPKRFANKRSESYWRIRKRLEDGDIALPPDDNLVTELMAIRWGLDSQGRVKLEAKGDLKDRLGRSPDTADAVAMSFAIDRLATVGGAMIDF